MYRKLSDHDLVKSYCSIICNFPCRLHVSCLSACHAWSSYSDLSPSHPQCGCGARNVRVTSDDVAWHCKHYTGRGVMKFYESGATPVQDMGVPVSRMEKSIEAHCQAPLKRPRILVEDRYQRVSAGSLGTKLLARRVQGRGFHHNVTSVADFAAQPSCYRMGSLEIDEDSAVKGPGLKPVPGFCATEEIVGDVHGNDRLGDNSPG